MFFLKKLLKGHRRGTSVGGICSGWLSSLSPTFLHRWTNRPRRIVVAGPKPSGPNSRNLVWARGSAWTQFWRAGCSPCKNYQFLPDRSSGRERGDSANSLSNQPGWHSWKWGQPPPSWVLFALAFWKLAGMAIVGGLASAIVITSGGGMQGRGGEGFF